MDRKQADALVQGVDALVREEVDRIQRELSEIAQKIAALEGRRDENLKYITEVALEWERSTVDMFTALLRDEKDRQVRLEARLEALGGKREKQRALPAPSSSVVDWPRKRP